MSDKYPDMSRLSRAQADLARVEARLKRDALKADVIAKIVKETAKNNDLLERPAVFEALAKDPDTLIELARQAGWFAEEQPATGTEMHRAGTILGRLLNAFQVPDDRFSEKPAASGSKRSEDNDQKTPLMQLDSESRSPLAVAHQTGAIPVAEPVRSHPVKTAESSLQPITDEDWKTLGIQPPMITINEPPRPVNFYLFALIGLIGAGFLGWLFG